MIKKSAVLAVPCPACLVAAGRPCRDFDDVSWTHNGRLQAARGEKVGPPGPRWTLDGALSLVREAQPRATAAGFYLALAGGVLNAGSSDNDLDLAAVCRTFESDVFELVEALAGLWGEEYSATRVAGFHHFAWPRRAIEVTVVGPPKG